jgi:hypothetical protein
LAKITDPYSRLSLQLQAAFGLRREESIKIRPEWADRGDRLALKDTWTKGGRAREIPIRNEEQRRVLDEAKCFAGRGSLIPADKHYVEQLRRFEHQCAKAGIHRIHGHRHQYAQTRYRELTGWAAPAAGGPRSKELTTAQKLIDQEARLTISSELGHSREQILAIYFDFSFMGDFGPVQAILFCIYSAIGQFFSAFTLQAKINNRPFTISNCLQIMWLRNSFFESCSIYSAISWVVPSAAR